jgi:heme exporter protein D
MIIEFFALNGYGQFVWPAFIFTFISCFSLYFKTKKEFLQQEELYSKEFIQLQTIKIETKDRKEIEKEALSASSL